MPEPIYRRVVVKLSGEALAGPEGFGIHQPTIDRIAADLVAARALGVTIAVVVGGGNVLRGPQFFNTDLSVFKNFDITERVKGQFRFEAYNALNHVQFGGPNTAPANTAFGTITGEKGHGQRQLTLGIRVVF